MKNINWLLILTIAACILGCNTNTYVYSPAYVYVEAIGNEIGTVKGAGESHRETDPNSTYSHWRGL